MAPNQSMYQTSSINFPEQGFRKSYNLNYSSGLFPKMLYVLICIKEVAKLPLKGKGFDMDYGD